MSTTFFAPDAQAATGHLDLNMSATNAGRLTILLGLDTKAAIDERGMVAGEVSALRVLAAIRQQYATGCGELLAGISELRALAEAAEAHNSTVAWA